MDKVKKMIVTVLAWIFIALFVSMSAMVVIVGYCTRVEEAVRENEE